MFSGRFGFSVLGFRKEPADESSRDQRTTDPNHARYLETSGEQTRQRPRGLMLYERGEEGASAVTQPLPADWNGLMKPQLNHLIVWSRDRHAAAAFFSEVMGMDEPSQFGHFTQVETGNGVAIDFADTTDEPSGMHLAFQVTERQFDEIYGRIVEKEIPHWADPRRSVPDIINDHDGGRGVYFGDPHTSVGWEIITRPYGSGPIGERHQPS